MNAGSNLGLKTVYIKCYRKLNEQEHKKSTYQEKFNKKAQDKTRQVKQVQIT